MSDDRKEIVFGKQLSSEDQANYRDRIAKARGGVDGLKGSGDKGGLPKPQGAPLLAKEGQQVAASITPDGGVVPRPPGAPLLSPTTQAQLAQVQNFNEQAKKEEAEPKKEDGKPTEEELSNLFEGFDFNGQRNEAAHILNNRRRREAIEKRCEPMDVEEMIMRDSVQQIVPIIPDKFYPTFRTYTPEENLFLKLFMAKTNKEEENQNDQYLVEKYSLCQLACGLVAINGSELPSHLDDKGAPSIEGMTRKLRTLLKKNIHVIADLMVNYAWFEIRARKLLNVDSVKNG